MFPSRPRDSPWESFQSLPRNPGKHGRVCAAPYPVSMFIRTLLASMEISCAVSEKLMPRVL